MQIKKQISGWLKHCAAAFSLVLATSAIGATDVTTYFHNDVSGTPMLATDAAGQVVWKETYRPYGQKLTNSAAADGNKVGYAGKPFDNNTGLSYMGARYYDPVLGRFTGIDPKEVDPSDLHSFNRYVFGNNNPYKFVDPDGRSPLDVAFLMYDLGKLGLAMYSGVGVGAAVADVAMSAVGVASPFPGVGQAMKAARTAEHAVGVGRGVQKASEAAVAAKTAEARAAEIHSVLDVRAQRARTTAVTETQEGIRVVSSSERRLTPAQRRQLGPNEVEGIGVGHAEATGIRSARDMGLTPTGTAASRPICQSCADTLRQNGVDAMSPFK